MVESTVVLRALKKGKFEQTFYPTLIRMSLELIDW